jgi:ABC-type transporter Mla maintaining outer membrane lipid asymmetry permease subunit MlaE
MPSKSTLIAIAILIGSFLIFPFSLFVGIAGGLLVGWNVLEQPAIIREYWDKAAAWVASKRH